MTSLLRVIKFAFQDIGRNLGLSSMTIFILVLMLLSVNTLWSMDVITKEAIHLIKNQVNISFYLTSSASDKTVGEIKSYLSGFPEVTSVTLLSQDEVLNAFKNRHQYSPEVLDALSELGGNPFGSTLIVQTKEPGDYAKIIEAMSVPEYQPILEGKSFEGHEDALNRIQTITSRVERIGLLLSCVFALIAFLIIFNMIRVIIHSQRVEIGIKRLVGANNWFIRGPYLVASVLFTFISVLVTFIILRFLTPLFDRYLSVVFSGNFSLTNYYQSHLLALVGLQFLAVLLLSVVSSGLAMRRQLKV